MFFYSTSNTSPIPSYTPVELETLDEETLTAKGRSLSGIEYEADIFEEDISLLGRDLSPEKRQRRLVLLMLPAAFLALLLTSSIIIGAVGIYTVFSIKTNWTFVSVIFIAIVVGTVLTFRPFAVEWGKARREKRMIKEIRNVMRVRADEIRGLQKFETEELPVIDMGILEELEAELEAEAISDEEKEVESEADLNEDAKIETGREAAAESDEEGDTK